MVICKDRVSAGILLAEKLHKYKGRKDAIVLGIPRGGVVLAYEIAKALKLPLDVVITRKIGDPRQPELALGAVDPSGEVIWDQVLMSEVGIQISDLTKEVQKQLDEIKRREQIYRVGKSPLDVQGKIVILVDDGIATGETMFSAVKYVKKLGAKKVVVAAPVGAADSIGKISAEADEMVIPYPQEMFGSVGSFYEDFGEVSDKEVVELLR